jgi:hypothetical protein
MDTALGIIAGVIGALLTLSFFIGTFRNNWEPWEKLFKALKLLLTRFHGNSLIYQREHPKRQNNTKET